MKNLLTLFTILLIGASLHGQGGVRDYANIKLRDTYVKRSNDVNDDIYPTTIEESIYKNKSFYYDDSTLVLEKNVSKGVYFINNNIAYILSYEEKNEYMVNHFNRNIYLYYKKLDEPLEPWRIASKDIYINDELVDRPVLTTEFAVLNTMIGKAGALHIAADFGFYNENRKSVGKVVKYDNGVVEMTIGIGEFRNGNAVYYDYKGKKVYKVPHTFIFTPMGNGKYYSVKRKFND